LIDQITKTNTALISIGSNIEPEKHIPLSLKLLEKEAISLSVSSVWQTPAVGSDGPDYLNTAVLFTSNLSLRQLRSQLLAKIELELGRVRTSNKYSDRTIDLDVVLYDNILVDDELWTQAHIALPASELLPDLVNPHSGENLSSIAQQLMEDKVFLLRSDIIPEDFS
jgi:2-amino-4-hydroxy-6-hydroxymethyldihydropteridine diphosphokinase